MLWIVSFINLDCIASMELNSLLWFLVMVSFYLPFVKSVVTMGGLLLLTSLVCTLVIGWSMGSWYGFILFLVYITGLLVLFGYMLAMSSNDKFSAIKHVGYSLILFFSGVVLWNWYNYEVIARIEAQSDFHGLVVGVYSNQTVLMYWFFAVVLFMALVMVVTLCYKSPKPLRGFVG